MADNNIGKVVNFDGYTGEIVDSVRKYIFLDKDCLGEIKTGDIVTFKSEKIYDTYRAFLVNNKRLNNSDVYLKNRKISAKEN